MSEVVTVNTTGGAPTLTLNDGGTATYAGGSGTSALTFSYTVAAGQNTAALAATAVGLNGASITDGSGNAANFSLSDVTQNGPQIDTTTPTVSSVVASGSGITGGNGDLGAGKVVTLTVNMSEAVSVNTGGGTPTLTLNDGGTATYSSGSGSSALVFTYTVAAGQNTSDLAITTFNANGGTITNGASTAANMTGAVINPAGTLQIDTATPTILSLVESPSSGDLNAGNTVTLTLNMSEVVTVNTGGGTPTLTLNDGTTATYSSGSGSNALVFTYTVAAGQNTPDLMVSTVNLNGATIADGAGNAASLSLTGLTQNGPQIDTTTPVISAIGEVPANGDLNAGKTVTYTLTMSEVVNVNTTGGSPMLSLNDGGTAAYVSGSGSNALTFSYTVAAGQNTPDLMVSVVNLDGATIADGAGNAASLSLTGLTQGSPQVDTTPPTVSSVTASAGDYNAGTALTLTLDMSEAVNVTGAPTLSLNDGGTASYVSGSGSSTLVFSYTVGAGQNTAALAVTGVTGTITDLAGNMLSTASLPETFAGVIIDTTPPGTPVVASDTVNANNSVTLSGTAEADSTVTLYDGVTTLGTTTANASGAWTYTTGVLTYGLQSYTATATDAAGNVSPASTALNVMVNTVAAGQTINGITVLSGARVVVESGGTANNTSVDSGGYEFVEASGTASGTTLSGGYQYVYGSASGTTLSTGGFQDILAGGTANSTTINSGGNQYDYGTASGTTLSGSQYVFGSASGTAVSSGGFQDILAGGLASNATINNGGNQYDFGTASDATVDSGGYQFVEASGAASGTTLSGGYQFVYGSASGTVLSSGGFQDILAGGTASSTTVNSGGVQYDYGTASGTTLSGSQYVFGSAIASGTVVSTGGIQDILAGGSASSATINSGGNQYDFGTASSTTVDSGGYQFIEASGTASNTTLSGGYQYVNGSVSGTVLSNGGFQDILSGGTANNTTINSGGIQYDYGAASGTTLGGSQYVYGSASGTVVSSGGVQDILAGGTASSTTIDSGGYQVVDAGGTISGATISGGTLELQNGANTGGSTIDFASGGLLKLDGTGTYNMLVAGFTSPTDVIDLTSINYASAKISFTEASNDTSGTLSVTDGTHTANITLLGQYTAASFTSASNGAGGISIVDPPITETQQSLLTQPTHG